MRFDLDTPIAVIIYNRPDKTLQLFLELQKIKPKNLYLIADGPKKNSKLDKELCERSRRIFDQVDWNCEVRKNFSETNLGCKSRVVSGLDWVFENCEKAIILEDDCIPSKTFFSYAADLLDRYESDLEIGMISGTNFSPQVKNKDDYFFSRYPAIWGWATWKRVWKIYDSEISDWPIKKSTGTYITWTEEKKTKRYWKFNFDQIYKNKIDTWDIQLAYQLLFNNLLTIVPRVNLVSNIGFGQSGTHTKNQNSNLANMERYEMNLPLNHPSTRIISREIDCDKEAAIFNLSLFNLLKHKILTLSALLKVDRQIIHIYFYVKNFFGVRK